MRQVVAIRAEPALAETVAAGTAIGLSIEAVPLFEVVPTPWSAPDPAEIDALLVGSANAFRHGGEGLQAFRDKPVHAVGERTADAARASGFAVGLVGDGRLQGVLDSLAPPLRLLRIGGAERIEIAAKQGITLTERACYSVEPRPIPDCLASWLRSGEAVVLLHSAAAARHFAAECDRASIPRSSVGLAVIGPRVAHAAGPGWARVETAPVPRDDALLALARDMCH